MMERAVIILAAGHGKRMHSALPKPLHLLAGKPLIGWALDTAMQCGAQRIIAITPPGSDNPVSTAIKAREDGGKIAIAAQPEPTGTGAAVEAARDALGDWEGTALITFADTPLITAATLSGLAEDVESGADIAVLGFRSDNNAGYGRIITGSGDSVDAIVEDRDADAAQKKITLLNAGVMAMRMPLGFELLAGLGSRNAQGEKYLTDCIAAATAAGHKVVMREADPSEVIGINARGDLARAEAVMQNRLRAAALEKGASMIAPETVYLAHDTVLEEDVTIAPHVVFGTGVRIGRGTVIKAFSHLEGVICGADCIIGPYARLRPGTEMGREVRVGNFVETKAARLGDGTKASHLSYLGDSEIGSGVNIGAGTITCNFDGVAKHTTTIGADAFIGSNTALIAPVRVGARAIVGAGSTIAADIADDALALTRPAQHEITEGASAFKARRAAKTAGEK